MNMKRILQEYVFDTDNHIIGNLLVYEQQTHPKSWVIRLLLSEDSDEDDRVFERTVDTIPDLLRGMHFGVYDGIVTNLDRLEEGIL